MVLEGCHSPSCLAAEERDFFAVFHGQTPFSKLLALIRVMPVKGVGGHELRGVPFT